MTKTFCDICERQINIDDIAVYDTTIDYLSTGGKPNRGNLTVCVKCYTAIESFKMEQLENMSNFLNNLGEMHKE